MPSDPPSSLGLQVLHRAGLEPERAASTLLFVDGYVRQQIALGLQYADEFRFGLDLILDGVEKIANR